MIFHEKLLKAAEELDLHCRRKVTTLLSGNYRSAFRGAGMEFKEFRRYTPGDDVRHISWPVTLRTRHAIVKLYEEERDLDIVVAVDVSGSSLLGTHGRSKIHMYEEITALLGLAASKASDRFGFLLFHDKPVQYFPPKRSRAQLMASLGSLREQPLHGQKTDLSPALDFLHRVLKRRTLIAILSDFEGKQFDSSLRALARRHECILLQGYDDAERGMSIDGVMEVCDPETGSFYLLDGNSPGLRRKLAENALARTEHLRILAQTFGADFTCLSVEDDYLQRMVHFFRHRSPNAG